MLGGAGPRHFGAFLSLILVVELAAVLVHLRTTPLPTVDAAAAAAARPVFDIGVKLFKEYAFAFEATSVLILVAMVGAIVLARKEQS
jgi:NADH-quinone oxidoreductase subunit J